MGADFSHLEPPRDWPFLGWDEDLLRRFLNFVKTDDEGSFRISKWKMLEFVGFEYVQEIARLFGTFESPGDTTVSSLHLAVALLLCNRGASVQFKVSECLSFFDWGDVGELTFYDLLFLMQACTQALVFFLPMATHNDQGLDALEGLCREAMSKDSESLEQLARWAHANQEVLRLLTLLSPQDADAGAALAQLPPPGPPQQQRALPARAEAEAPPAAASAAPAPAPPAGDAGPGAPEEEEASAAAGEPGLAEADGSQADGPGDADELEQDDAAVAEPPLLPAETEHGRLAEALQQHLGSARQGLGLQIAAEERRLRASADATGRAAALGRIWARALGASLPTLPSSWMTPLQGGPFKQPASAEALRVGLTDWAWIRYSAVVEEARYEAALVAAGLYGGEASAAAALRRGAREAAAEELDAWMQASADSLAEDVGQAVKLIESERASLEESELKAARLLEAAASRCGPSLRRVQRGTWRFEGAAEYLTSLRSQPSAPEAAPQLRKEAESQLARLRKDLGKIREASRKVEERRAAFLKAFFMREAFAAAAANAHDPGAALALRITELRSGGGASDAAEGDAPGRDFGCYAADALEACEPCWRRAEGRLAAAGVLRWGGTLDFQLRAQESRRLDRAARRSEAAQILVAGLGGGAKQDGAVGPPRRRIRLLESLLAPLEQSAAVAPPQERLQAVLPALLGSAAASLATPPSGRLLSPAPQGAAARRTISGETVGDGGSSAADSAEVDLSPLVGVCGALDLGAGAGSEIADDSSDDGSDSEECWRLHAVRFERRARRAALAAAGSALQAGQLPKLVERLRESLAAAEGQVAEAPERRQEVVRRKLEAALDESLAGAPDRGEKLQVALACVRHALRDAYVGAHGASSLPSCGTAASRSSLQPPALPLEPQPTLPFAADADCLGLAASGLRRQAAHAVGALRAVEAIRLAAGDGGGGAGAEAELLRLAELRAEARLLAALAAHRLARAELELRALAGGAGRGRSPCGRRGSGQDDGGSGPAGSLAEELVDASARASAACRREDVQRVLGHCAQDERLGPRTAAAVDLVREFGKLVSQEVVEEEGAAAPAPAVPPLVQWWRPTVLEGPLFMGGGGSPCPRCLEISQLTWRHLGGGAEEPPKAWLWEHAAAWRLAALADGQLLALEALAQGAWGHLLLRQRWLDARRPAERLWRGELARQQAALLGRSQRDCLVRARDYLHALDPDDVRFLCREDMDEQAEALAEDLRAALQERARSEFPAARDALVDAKLRGCVLEGLHEGAEAARLELHADADLDEARSPSPAGQVALFFAVEQALATGRRSKAGLALEGADKRLVKCRGSLRGIAGLRSFVAALPLGAEA